MVVDNATLEVFFSFFFRAKKNEGDGLQEDLLLFIVGS